MKRIDRPGYSEKIKSFLTAPVIIVVTGMRRVGKSVLLRQLMDELADSGHVIYIDKESLEYDEIENARDLVRWVEERTVSGPPSYVIVDEIQLISDWERAAAALASKDDTHLIISGSNAQLLSGDLATRIAGRYVSIPIFPLSLNEFSDLYSLLHIPVSSGKDLFALYLKTGGLPGLLHTDLSTDVYTQMQKDIFNTIVVKDIITRHNIRDVRLLQDVMQFSMDNIGSLFSAKRISDFLKKERRNLSVDSVLNYLEYMREGFLLYRVSRYDIKGKKLLEVLQKYYLGDIGLRNGLVGYRDSDISGLLENLVYLELLRRGFTVRIGTLPDSEVDFIAEKEPHRLYIQVSYLLESASTIDRELAPLKKLEDAWPKLLLSLDEYQPRVFEGIRHISIIDFLMGGEI
ncbi:MAG: ATP-binding protein [Spirochaetia bacterium]